jgi:prepilin-type N-terminal cleavage/methylation domain-containing protein
MVRRPRAGFTLVELLAVMLLIAILLGIILGAALYLIKTARSNRSQHTATTLKTALVNYRHEYGRWPVPWVPPADPWPSSDPHFKTNGMGDHVMTATGDDNKMVFDLLRTDNSDANANPKGIPFLDETAVLALAGGQRMTYHMARAKGSPPFPLVYTMRNGGTEYFTVTINFDQETAAVERPRDD